MSHTGSIPRIALGAAVLCVAGYLAWQVTSGPTVAPTVSQPISVEFAVVTRRDVAVHLANLRTVEPVNTVTICSRVDGELQQVPFREGQDIKQGDLVAVILPRTFQAALDRAKGRLDQDNANLAIAQLLLGRVTKLGRKDLVSAQTVDDQRSRVVQLEAQIEQDKAAISEAETQLSYTRIASPIDGRAGLRLVDVGNIVHANAQAGLVVIDQLHPIAAISTIPERDVPAIRAALAAGSELGQPLGYAIVGGLLVSQLLTLYTTPVIYLYLDRFNGRAAAADHAPDAVEVIR